MEIAYLADHPEYVMTIANWYYDMWGYADPANSVEKTIQRLQGKLNRNELPIPIVAIDPSGLLGTAQLKRHEMDIYPDREYWLGSVYVDPSARGKGIGRMLVSRIIEIAEQSNISELWLQTVAKDGGLYTRCGFKPYNEVQYNGEHVLVMKRELTG